MRHESGGCAVSYKGSRESLQPRGGSAAKRARGMREQSSQPEITTGLEMDVWLGMASCDYFD
jgi:hypothetical protein